VAERRSWTTNCHRHQWPDRAAGEPLGGRSARIRRSRSLDSLRAPLPGQRGRAAEL